MLSLEDHFYAYKKGEMSKNHFVSLVFVHIQKNIRRYLQRIDDEDAMDYLIWMYPRLNNAIDRYVFQNSSFEAYIATTVRLGIREYREQTKTRREMEFSYWEADCKEKDTLNRYENIQHEEDKAEVRYIRNKNRKKILILLLKCYRFLDDSYIRKAAGALGMSFDELLYYISMIKKKREERDAAISVLRDQMQGQFYRYLSYQNCLVKADTKLKYHELQKRIQRHHKRLVNVRKRYWKAVKSPSNSEIAEVLGIAKGTVDTVINRARKAARELPG
jgi:DNA-directed RNA polymerase specialized sigma24 family protein